MLLLTVGGLGVLAGPLFHIPPRPSPGPAGPPARPAAHLPRRARLVPGVLEEVRLRRAGHRAVPAGQPLRQPARRHRARRALPARAAGRGQARALRARARLDVAVDLRPGPTFLRHAVVELSAAEFAQLWIPPGFAHGYCTLTDDSEVAYKTTAEYAPALERTLRWDDPDLAIPWPVLKAHLSPRDASAPGVAQSALPLVA